jgi:protein phosphatase
MLDLEYSQFSDRGPTRERNEDYAGSVLPDTPHEMRSRGWLFAVADGVGGHSMGDVASRTAVESVRAGFRRAPAGEQLNTTLTRLVQQASSSVLAAARTAGPDGTGMATTLVLCALRYDRAVIAHVGDSRCYRIQHNTVTQLTNDHTVANEQKLMGLITAQEFSSSANKHLLSRSIGMDLFVAPDLKEVQVITGDIFVLCSDGMHNGVTDADLLRIAGKGGDLNKLTEKLAQHAMEQDGRDNVTVTMIRVRDVERIGMYRGRPYKIR